MKLILRTQSGMNIRNITSCKLLIKSGDDSSIDKSENSRVNIHLLNLGELYNIQTPIIETNMRIIDQYFDKLMQASSNNQIIDQSQSEDLNKLINIGLFDIGIGNVMKVFIPAFESSSSTGYYDRIDFYDNEEIRIFTLDCETNIEWNNKTDYAPVPTNVDPSLAREESAYPELSSEFTETKYDRVITILNISTSSGGLNEYNYRQHLLNNSPHLSQMLFIPYDRDSNNMINYHVMKALSYLKHTNINSNVISDDSGNIICIGSLTQPQV